MDIPPNFMMEMPELNMDRAKQIIVQDLALAAKYGLEDKVTEILKRGEVDINSKYKQCTSLYYASEAGNEDIVKLLIENKADVNAIGGKAKKTPLHVTVSNDFPHLVEIFLNTHTIQANIVDAENDTPLMTAIQLHNKECVRLFLSSDKWTKHMSVVKRGDGDHIDTPMRQLIRQMPDMACYVMDNCIKLGSYKDSKNSDFSARFYFAFLDDTYTSSNWRVEDGSSATYTLGGNEIIGYDNPSLITTPTSQPKKCKDFVDNNVLKMGEHSMDTDGPSQERNDERFVHTSDETTEAVSLVCDAKSFRCNKHGMSCELSKSANPYSNKQWLLKENHPLFIAYNEKRKSVLGHPLAIALINHKWQTIGRYSFYGGLLLYIVFVSLLTAHFTLANVFTTSANISQNSTDGPTTGYQENAVDLNIISVILVVLWWLNVSKEIFIMWNDRAAYFVFERLLELTVYIFSAALVLDAGLFSHTLGGYPLAAVCIFLAWFNILLRVRPLPFIGIFIIMFMRILKNSIIVLLIFFPIILGFAFTFSILLDFMPLFRKGVSIATILVMLSGEVEYVDTLTAADSEINPNSRHKEITITAYVFFVLLIVICLFNLLVGLAVSDVDTLHKESEAEMQSLKTNNVMSSAGKRAACGCLRYQPNKIAPCLIPGLTNIHIIRRAQSWFNGFDYRLGTKNLLKTVRKDRVEQLVTFDLLRKEMSNMRTQIVTDVEKAISSNGKNAMESRVKSKSF